jgi:hypothetical protein
VKRALQLLLVEDDRERKDRYIEYLKRAFSKAEASVTIDFRESFDNIEDRLKQRPHIAIFDNVFVSDGREQDNVGIANISKYKPTHRDTVFALYTERTFVIDQLGVRLPNPDLLLTKTYMSNANYQDYLGNALAMAVHRFPFGSLSFREPRHGAEFREIMPELRSVVEQCLFGFWHSDLDDEPLEVRLHPLTGGFSGSSVFQLEFFGLSRYENIPFVLKFSKRANVSDEARRYNAFVRLQLPHDMRVDLIGYGEAGEWAGVCYAFAFGQAMGVATLTDRLRSGGGATVSAFVDRVLASENTRWYRAVTHTPQRVDDFFANSEEYSPAKDARRLEGFQSALHEIGSAEGKRSSVSAELFCYDTVECPSLRRTLARINFGTITLSFGHGDLNANNIFITPDDSNFALIDFEYSGLDHCFKDFISLESSLRLEFQSPSLAAFDLSSLIELELAALTGESLPADPKPPEYFAEIVKVRNAAQVRFPNTSEPNYQIALGLHSLKLLGLPLWKSDQKRALCAVVFASALASSAAVRAGR